MPWPGRPASYYDVLSDDNHALIACQTVPCTPQKIILAAAASLGMEVHLLQSDDVMVAVNAIGSVEVCRVVRRGDVG